jgi:hypothetical protein
MTTLLHLAEQKYARQLAEAKNPNSTIQPKEPWRLLLDAMIETMPDEQRERVVALLRGNVDGDRLCPGLTIPCYFSRGMPGKCARCGQAPPVARCPRCKQPQPVCDEQSDLPEPLI